MNNNNEMYDVLRQAEQAPVAVNAQSPAGVGYLKVKTADDWMLEAASIPDPVMLWKELFIQGEVCCLFADTNVGKSILAVQIGRDIALSGKKVLYLDFELTAKQFETRYREGECVYRFPDNFLRGEIDSEMYDGENLERTLIPNIRYTAEFNGCDVVIIDNLTWLTSTAEHGEAAANLMKALLQIKRELGISILVLAHTPKRAMDSPISQNDLAGSKQLINFFDAAFSIGRSSADTNMRYIKQIKARSTELCYGADNVITCEICKEGCFLSFHERSYDHELLHLRKPSEKETDERQSKIMQLHNEGYSVRKIAETLSLSRGTVQRVIEKTRA